MEAPHVRGGHEAVRADEEVAIAFGHVPMAFGRVVLDSEKRVPRHGKFKAVAIFWNAISAQPFHVLSVFRHKQPLVSVR